MPTLGAPLEFSKYEARNLRAHVLGAAPSSPVTGQMYYNSGDNTLYWWDGTQWVSSRGGVVLPDASTTVKGIVQLTGDLAGTATNPQIAAGVITDADVNGANKDGAAGTASMRTLGTGANQAAPGNDARFTAPVTPLAHKATHEPGGSDPLTVDAAVGVGSLRTLGAGAAQAMPGNRTLDAITIPAAAVNLNNKLINSLADPVAASDAANKNYVDNTAQGLDAKASVRAASVANIAALSGAQTIDGIGLVAGDRVLVKDQTAQAQNGIYVVAAGAWSRAPDTDTWNELISAFTFVESGTVNADSGWVSIVDPGGTLNTTVVNWVQFSGAGQVNSGAGLTKTGNTLDVGQGAGITVNADSIQIANNGVTNAMIADGAVALNTADVTGTLGLANGGTGQTAAKAARETGLGAAGYYTSATHGASTTISVPQATHGLRASRGLMVQVQNESDGAIELPDVTVAANGDITVTYGASVAANSKRVTVIG